MWNRLLLLYCVGITLVLVPACSVGGPSESPAVRRHLNLAGRNDSRPYSHAVVAGNTIYIAGTIGDDPKTGRPPSDARAEAKLALDGMRRKVELAGATMDDLVMVQVFCSDVSLYEEFNAVYETYFKERFPVRAFVGSGPLLRGARFEVNGIAVID